VIAAIVVSEVGVDLQHHLSLLAALGAALANAVEPLVGASCVGTLGETAIVPPSVVFSADRNLAAVRLVANGVSAPLFQFWLNTLWVQQHLGVVSGSTAQPHLYLNDLRALPVPVMPRDEQRAVVEAIAEAASRVAAAASARMGAAHEVARLERAILARAFRGELVPQDPNDEPAQAMPPGSREARSRTKKEARPSGLQARGRQRAAE